MLATLALLAAYHHAWITHNAEQVAQLFTENAVYHPHPYGRKTYALQPTSTMCSSGQTDVSVVLSREPWFNLSLCLREGWNREEAEDLTAHIFLKAVCHLDYQQNSQSIRSWLFQVTRTTIADYWRAYYRGATSSLDALLEAGWEGPIEHEDEDRLFEFSSSADHVQRLLQALPERDREVLTCRFLLGLSIRETAGRMGLTEGNVKTSQFRALKHAADL